MKQVRPVTGANLNEFAEAMNEAYCELSRFTIEKTEHVPGTLDAIIFYDIPDEPEPVQARGFCDADYDIEVDGVEAANVVRINLAVGDNSDRHCCECDNYNWGHGCPYRDRHVQIMDRACPMFNVTIEVGP